MAMKTGIRRILIADDHAAVRNGIRSLLEPWPQMQVVAEAASGAEALEIARSSTPDIAIMDLSLPGGQGIDLILGVKRESPETQVLIYTMYRSEKLVRAALFAGASFYVVKGDPSSDLLAALMNCR
ncbi:MAG TPA: response regulator transcription factor [Allosphingosinicella sp.]|nr:response regulator transcription factor [Allosphingosinicella sp.]